MASSPSPSRFAPIRPDWSSHQALRVSILNWAREYRREWGYHPILESFKTWVNLSDKSECAINEDPEYLAYKALRELQKEGKIQAFIYSGARVRLELNDCLPESVFKLHPDEGAPK